jgi:hypothetical protein
LSERTGDMPVFSFWEDATLSLPMGDEEIFVSRFQVDCTGTAC